MALALVIGGITQTTKILEGSASLKYNTLDLTLVDPATFPLVGDAVTLTTPSWTGVVTSRTIYPGPRVGHKYCTVTATNTNVPSASAGPWGLSDVPNGTTLRGYKDLRVTESDNLDGTSTTTGTATLYTTGLWPAMTFTLTNADLGYAAYSFSVTGMEVTWKKGVPFYNLTFGSPIVTMSVWMADTVINVADGTISGTKITDGSVTTPKLAANSVTTTVLGVGDIGNNVTNPGFETGDLTGWGTNNSGGGVTSVWSGHVHAGKYAAHLVTNGGNAAVVGTATASLAGESVTVGAWLYGSGSGTADMGVLCYDGAMGYLGHPTLLSTGVLAGSFTHYSVTSVTLASTVYVVPYVVATGGTYVDVDDVTLQRGSVVMDSSGITVNNGALTVTNGSSIVIIDGTSDMFKIAASGSLSSTCAALSGANYSTSVATATLSGLGTLAATPMHLSSIADNNGNTGTRSVGHDLLYNVPAAAWTGVTSGGATSGQAILPTSIAGNMATHLNGSSICVVQLDVNNAYTSSETLYGYYYILVESAL
jgi:hypothetical protein